MRAWLGSIAAFVLIGCASRPLVVSESLPPGISAGARDFAVEAPTDAAARAALPEVVSRLESFGFRQSREPALLVLISASQRQRGVGAFAASDCDPRQWVSDPSQKWLIGGGQAMSLEVLIVEARSGRTLYRTSAYRRTSRKSVASNAAGLAAAALSTDPRLARVAGSRCSQ
ncbi:MAG TPA: hypothetical protein VM711_01810 [Sphingomicrobium sp.]|nr:hypothetical protein [Sphingomicrobium sp.]